MPKKKRLLISICVLVGLGISLALGYLFRYRLMIPWQVMNDIEMDLPNHLTFRSSGPYDPSNLIDRWFGYQEFYYEILEVVPLNEEDLLETV